jgi:uncharacterized membrane protein YukC
VCIYGGRRKKKLLRAYSHFKLIQFLLRQFTDVKKKGNYLFKAFPKRGWKTLRGIKITFIITTVNAVIA